MYIYCIIISLVIISFIFIARPKKYCRIGDIGCDPNTWGHSTINGRIKNNLCYKGRQRKIALEPFMSSLKEGYGGRLKIDDEESCRKAGGTSYGHCTETDRHYCKGPCKDESSCPSNADLLDIMLVLHIMTIEMVATAARMPHTHPPVVINMVLMGKYVAVFHPETRSPRNRRRPADRLIIRIVASTDIVYDKSPRQECIGLRLAMEIADIAVTGGVVISLRLLHHPHHSDLIIQAAVVGAPFVPNNDLNIFSLTHYNAGKIRSCNTFRNIILVVFSTYYICCIQKKMIC